MKLVATCALGLESLLEDETAALGFEKRWTRPGAVVLEGTWQDVWRLNLWLRTANRVLVELGRWQAADGEALYRGVRELVLGDQGWGRVSSRELFDPARSLSVRATTSRSQMRDVRWVALRVKDGVVDAQRQRYGHRASVERRHPDLPLRLWLHRDRATLLLDTSGVPLDRRGYRAQSLGAPVRESLAAACVLASGWNGEGAVVDPMCGTGTLLTEAAWIAARWAPGRLRSTWLFERFPGFEQEAFAKIRAAATGGEGEPPRLIGRDDDPEAVAAAQINMAQAGLGAAVQLSVGSVWDSGPGDSPSGLVLVNPPYGRRLQRHQNQWRRLGDLLKQQFAGWTAVVLAGDPDRGKWIGLRPRSKLPVRNGPIDARILVFDLY